MYRNYVSGQCDTSRADLVIDGVTRLLICSSLYSIDGNLRVGLRVLGVKKNLLTLLIV